MPKKFKAEQVFNGTWGEAWLDGEYLAQVTALKAEDDRFGIKGRN